MRRLPDSHWRAIRSKEKKMNKYSIGIGMLLLIAWSDVRAQQNPPPKQVPPQQVPPQQIPTQPKSPPQSQAPPQQKAPPIADRRGQVVRVDPAKGVVVMQAGEGPAAKEFQYRLNASTRFWGVDRALVADGLKYNGFRPGATVWYRVGDADNAQNITEMRFYDPGQVDRKGDVVTDIIRGQIVQVDPAKNTLVLRTADGDIQFRVGDGSRFWDEKKVLIAEGLTYRGFKPGATVWVRLGTGDNAGMVTELRFFDPSQPEADLRGQIVRVDPDKNIFVVRTGVGEVEYRVTAKTSYWDANKVAFADGLRHATFLEGANVWFRLGTVENARVVTELRFYDPNQPEVMPDLRGQVVRVDPDKKTIRLLTGVANLAREVEYGVTADTRFWDADKMIITEGLAYSGFRQGVTVWFRLGTSANANVVTEVRFYDPGPITTIAKDPNAKDDVVADVRGRIVRVDPEKNIVIVRTGQGETAREFEYRVTNTTRYLGSDQQVISDGLRYRGFQPNADVWYRLRTIDNSPVLTELRFYDPTAIKGKP
jgi:hypothetical protein